MAEYGVVNKPYLSWNSVVLTSHVTMDGLRQQIEKQEDTESGDTSRTYAPGLIVNSINFELNQDYAASGAGAVDATLGAGVAARTVAAIIYRRDSGAKSTTNPEYTGSCFIGDYDPGSGPIGTMAKAKVTFEMTTALTRDAS